VLQAQRVQSSSKKGPKMIIINLEKLTDLPKGKYILLSAIPEENSGYSVIYTFQSIITKGWFIYAPIHVIN